ncbi:MAG: carbon monoxide dehydrogenase, partial [Desulfobacterales bacterium]|nr:carbon monoxide dehydrogenase [Desulfobacterales bacterium]
GCACPENTVLKRMLTKLLLSPAQVVLLDMEAGVEHLGRGTIAGVDNLLIVVIPSKSSVRTAQKIKKLAVDSGIPKISFVGNLVQDEDDENFLEEALGETPAAFFTDSSVIRKAERNGQPLTQLTEPMTEAPDKLVAFLQQSQG